MNTQATAKLSYLRLAPRKVRLVANFIRGLKADKALLRLQMVNKEAKRPLLKLLQSAVANATNNLKMEKESLRVKSVIVNEGPILYRHMPHAMGRATTIRKRTCHVSIVLEGESGDKKTKKQENKKAKE